MKAIIAAIDYSPASINAAHYAADLSVAVGAELFLINVVQVPVTVSEVDVSGYALDRMFRESEAELHQLEDTLTGYTKNRIRIHSDTLTGTVAFSLEQEAKKRNAFAVVIGTDSMTPVDHLFIEDHALAMVHSISTPVLIIPEKVSYKKISKIVLTADFRESEKILPLQLLKEWMKIFNPRLDIVSVVKKSQSGHGTASGSIALQNELEQFKPEIYFIYDDKAKEGIDTYIRVYQPDMLITIPGKYDFFSSLFHKSQSKQLIRNPQVPVLSILD